jgi:hypothetical protein
MGRARREYEQGGFVAEDVMQRWEAFIQRVTGRLSEILRESDAGFEGLLADPDLDPITFVNAMNAIEIRYKDLYGKLSATYSAQIVTPLLGRVGAAEKRLHDAETWMEDSFQRFKTNWQVKLVHALWARVGPLMNRVVPCTRCGAVLENRTLFHQAESVTCKHCNAVNSVSPDPLVYTYFAMAPDMIADERTVAKRLSVERACARGASKAEKIALWEDYWKEYATARATVVPMPVDEQQRFVESRVLPIRKYG